MKLKYIIITVLGLAMFTGCQDFLDVQPISEIGEGDFYTNAKEVETAMIGVYDALQEVPKREFTLTEMRSDNAKTRLSEGDWGDCEILNIGSTNSMVLAYWNANYITIYRANTVLNNLDVVSDNDLRSQFEGEAKFIRAMCHYNLVRLYKNIPYVDRTIYPNEASTIEQTPEATVYENIVADLNEAISLLPGKSGIANGRATSGAAQALLGKVYLATGDYSSAQAAFSKVIGTDYALEESFNDVFYTEQNDEIIFAVQYINDDADNSEDFSMEFTWAGVASGVNTPTDDIIADFDVADSIRFATSFLADSSEVGKFVSSSSDPEYGGNDWIVIRYADVLLMYVEAVAAGGTTTDGTAVGYFNEVRSRAGMPAVDAITQEDLLRERRLELAFENSRWFDLERFGVAAEVLTAFGNGEGGFSFQSTDLNLPIPQREMAASDVFVQNDY